MCEVGLGGMLVAILKLKGGDAPARGVDTDSECEVGGWFGRLMMERSSIANGDTFPVVRRNHNNKKR